MKLPRLTPARRARIYVLLTALVPVAVAYGLIADTQASLWLAVAAALLGSGGSTMAAWHTPILSKDRE
ncbi:hypothetical protein SAMN04488550_4112 [Gordonia malaquae]|uniref:Uncharacterized protein n=1 Tax=Gordonia malaquae NBRC 108250 TaxID=1223542 RepID=M3VGU8_GORML|nr:hypothetical protein [Gordonia malaquae]GAC81214.1 hypothetical protein GM1_030_00430 [Gordonia malaquae NBRC 108250]SEE23362.1 hypothetical protein SAMN04488550_4112 [Gordonia malaquae]